MKDEMYDLVILGGGASGCMLATLARCKCAIIDCNQKLGKKLLVTGNGRCNLTNLNMSSSFYNQNIDGYLSRFDSKDTIDCFRNMGLETYADSEGRVYPVTNMAKSVVDVLDYQIKKNKIDLFLGENVQKVAKNGDFFDILTDKRHLVAPKVVVAMGGDSCQKIAKDFGLEYKDCHPSLVSLKTKRINHLKNIRVHDALLTLSVGGKTYSQRGEILFREDGISGICVFNLSARLARLGEYGGMLSIDMLPSFDIEKLKANLKNRKSIFDKMENFFDGLLAPNVAFEIMQRCKLTKDMSVHYLRQEDIDKIAYEVKNLSFEIKGQLENNQVFSGGLCLDALDDNLQCKKVKNLYFVGEACDVDGECGGYNLQWAWTSAKIVGEVL